MTTEAPVPPPEPLGGAGRALWADVCGTYLLGPHEQPLLAAACRMLDTATALDAKVDSDGFMVPGSQGQRVLNPAVGEARQQRLGMARLLAMLALPDDAGSTIRSPQQLRGSAAAQQRWRGQRRAEGA